MPQNLPEQILQRIVRLSADGNSQREVARMLGLSQGCISKNLRLNRETGRPHQRKRGGSMKISTPREDRQLLRMIRMNRLSRLLICEAHPPIWETDVSSNHLKTASGRRILVSASSQLSKAHFGAQATLPWMGDETQSVGPQTTETLYLQWWVPVLSIPQWRSGPGAP